MVRFMILGVLLLAVGSCASPEFIKRKEAARPETAASCAAKGQALDNFGMFGIPSCVTKYADASKVCRNRSECQGDCLVELGSAEATTRDYRVGAEADGQCARQLPLDGCLAAIDGGKVTHAECVD